MANQPDEIDTDEEKKDKEVLQTIYNEFSEFRAVFTKKHLIDECYVANMADDKAEILATFLKSIQESEIVFLNNINYIV